MHVASLQCLLIYDLGPRHRFPPRHPLLRPLAKLVASTSRRRLSRCAASQLDLWAMRKSR